MSRPHVTHERFYTEPARLAPNERGDARAADLPPTADIAARLRGGTRLETIADQYGMTVSGLRNRMRKSGWGSDGQKLTDRAIVMCEWCGHRTQGPRVCINCRSIQAHANDGYAYEHGLYGGRWVVKRGVKVWVDDGLTGEAVA